MTKHIVSKEILAKTLSLPLPVLEMLPASLGISIDTRTIVRGEVFFAIRGEIHDGHDYIDAAFKAGASLVIAEKKYEHAIQNSGPLVLVDDTLSAFSDLARDHLRHFNLIKIAITGSNGKTTTKEMLKAALGNVIGCDKVYASSGNKNNHFGVPLSALEITAQHTIAIFEMGMNHAHEIEHLCSIIEPTIGAITNISSAHEGNFLNGIDGVQQAKGELFQSLVKINGIAALNCDDKRVVQEATRAGIKTAITFGRDECANIKVVSQQPFSMDAQSLTLMIDNQKIITCSLPLAGVHHTMNAACALAIIKALDLSIEKAALGIMNMEKMEGRMSIFSSRKGYVLINDGYNANPTSMKAGILATLEFTAKRRIAAIGAMGELGSKSADYHFELGQLLADHFDYLFICGCDGKFTVAGATHAGMREENIILTESSLELINPLTSLLMDGDLVFIKGSSSANMQPIAHALRTNEGLN